jgi:hypothetical protein
MKQVAFAGAFVATLLVAFTAASATPKINYTVNLSWTQEAETPNVGNHDPGGTAKLTYDPDTKRLCGTITWTDLTGPPTGIHLHQAPQGQPASDGSVKMIIPTPPAGATSVSFNFTLDTSFETSLMQPDTELYLNIHTAQNPTTPGEDRTFYPWDNTSTTETPCPAPTNPDGGASTPTTDGGGTPIPVPTTTSTFGTTSGTSPGSSGSTGATPPASGDGTSSGDAPPAAKKGGCSTTGSPANALSFALVVGLGVLAATGRLRRRSKL